MSASCADPDAQATARDVGAPALDRFVRAAPLPQRTGLRAVLALARRPRGAALLARLPAADQLARATLAMVRYDDPRAARPLGWDADAVIARGRALRAADGTRW